MSFGYVNWGIALPDFLTLHERLSGTIVSSIAESPGSLQKHTDLVMTPIAAPIILSLLCLACPAQAQDVDCDNATSNVEMTYCGWEEFERADTELNRIYKEAIGKIRLTGGDLPAGRDAWEKKLRETQRAWVAFRDLNCDELLAIEWGGGTGTNLAIATCRTDMTNARITTLRERYIDR
ncbi:MAG: DUF1311 domain-containing protein [Hyphomicrobiales bacterium]|nr:DUF1311 domain-containing protein [Hyphomicrobiales bacterium]